jgi:hypothetical protein
MTTVGPTWNCGFLSSNLNLWEGDLKKSIAEHIIFNKVYIVHLKFVLSCIANCYTFNS